MVANRQSQTTIACSSAGDASRLANLLAASWTGPGAKPDLIEANGGEVDLFWYSQPVAAATPVAAISAVRTASTNIASVTYKHVSGGSSSTGSD